MRLTLSLDTVWSASLAGAPGALDASGEMDEVARAGYSCAKRRKVWRQTSLEEVLVCATRCTLGGTPLAASTLTTSADNSYHSPGCGRARHRVGGHVKSSGARLWRSTLPARLQRTKRLAVLWMGQWGLSLHPTLASLRWPAHLG